MLLRIRTSFIGRTHLQLYLITPLNLWCRRHRYHERSDIPSESDHMLRTESGSHTYTDRHAMTIILSHPTRPPGFQDWLAQVPRMPGNRTPVQPGPPEWGGYWRVCQGTGKRYLESVDRLHSRVSITCWNAAPITGLYSGRKYALNTVQAMANHWGPALKADGNRLQSSVTKQLNSEGTTSEATRRKTLIQKTSHCGRFKTFWWESPLHQFPWSN